MKAINPVLLGYGAAGLAALYIITRIGAKVAEVVPGIVSGNNAITGNQTNAGGVPTAAYQGAGILGTLGATFNAASGGVFASMGESLGSWTFETFGQAAPAVKVPRVLRPPPVDPAIMDRWDAYTIGSQRSATGSGSVDPWIEEIDLAAGGYWTGA